eukprot:361929-Chlamydomonas_euryale.AAC.4
MVVTNTPATRLTQPNSSQINAGWNREGTINPVRADEACNRGASSDWPKACSKSGSHNPAIRFQQPDRNSSHVFCAAFDSSHLSRPSRCRKPCNASESHLSTTAATCKQSGRSVSPERSVLASSALPRCPGACEGRKAGLLTLRGSM